MTLILQQHFPLGRFNATRWKQNPFEDRYGEWPPSPWRLLRALAARWIQYSREVGDDDIELRDRLLRSLAISPPEFSLPAFSWRMNPSVRQYHKTGIEWTAKGKKDSAYKKTMTSLVPDQCQTLPTNEFVYWIWPELDLLTPLKQLLDQLLSRVLYFGRAESFCHIRKIEALPEGVKPNCRLSEVVCENSPVLVATPGRPLNLDSLLAASDDALLRGRSVPPGAAWFYAEIPQSPTTKSNPSRTTQFPAELQVIQFAVGGRVYPQIGEWIRVTERFRGATLKELARRLTGDREATFAMLPQESRHKFSLFSGKTGDGMPLTGQHRHVSFALVPDEHGLPTRLVCFRSEPFKPDEVAALLDASEWRCSWRFSQRNQDGKLRDEWQLRFVPLPFDTPPPRGMVFDAPVSRVWESATPFVVPGGRKRFRKNGKLRPGETTERLLLKLLDSAGYPAPSLVLLSDKLEWVSTHESRMQRKERRMDHTRVVLPGYRFRITFPTEVSGPISIGHSSHFGLGLFLPVEHFANDDAKIEKG
jgi:CRISPR-associated protein Csb2